MEVIIMTKNIKVVSVDVGFGFVKATNWKRKQVSFPSVFQKSVAEMNGFGSNKNYKIKINDENYYIGEKAIEEEATREMSSQDSFDQERYFVLLATAISQLANNDDEIELRIGLPIRDFFGSSEKVQELGKFLKNKKIKTELNGVTKKIKIDSVKILPQGYGAFVYLSSVNQIQKNEKIGIIDVGYRTVDYILLKEGNVISSKTGSLEESGMHYIYSDIADQFEQKNHKKMKAEDVEEYITKDKKISNINIEKTLTNQAKNIASQINSKWSNVTMLDQIFVVGGGSKQLAKEIKDNLAQHNDQIREVDSKRTQYINALGYQAV